MNSASRWMLQLFLSAVVGHDRPVDASLVTGSYMRIADLSSAAGTARRNQSVLAGYPLLGGIQHAAVDHFLK